MDQQRFDDLTRALGAGASRRGVVKRLAAAVAAGLLGLGGHGVRAQDEDDFVVTADGGTASAGSKGGTVTGGDIVTGGNTGGGAEVSVTAGGEGGDADVVAQGADVTSSTELDVGADGGEAVASASGGSDNTVEQVEVTSCYGPLDECLVEFCCAGPPGIVCAEYTDCGGGPELITAGTRCCLPNGAACTSTCECCVGVCPNGVCIPIS